MARSSLHSKAGRGRPRSPTLTVDPNGCILDVDAVAEAWLEAPRSEFVGRQLRDLVADDLHRLEEVLRSVRGAGGDGAMLTSLVFRREGRALRRCIVRLRPLKHRANVPAGTITLQVEDTAAWDRNRR